MNEIAHPMGICQGCGEHFRLLADGTVRAHGQTGGGRCSGSRLSPAPSASPWLDAPIRTT